MTLKHTAVLRKGYSEAVRRFKPATEAVELRTGYDNTERRELWLAFTTSASGGNRDTPAETNYRVLIGTDDWGLHTIVPIGPSRRQIGQTSG